jgi:hypothetical protein
VDLSPLKRSLHLKERRANCRKKKPGSASIFKFSYHPDPFPASRKVVAAHQPMSRIDLQFQPKIPSALVNGELAIGRTCASRVPVQQTEIGGSRPILGGVYHQ